MFNIKESILELEDNLIMAIESVTGEEEKFFDLEPQPIRTRPLPSPQYYTKL